MTDKAHGVGLADAIGHGPGVWPLMSAIPARAGSDSARAASWPGEVLTAAHARAESFGITRELLAAHVFEDLLAEVVADPAAGLNEDGRRMALSAPGVVPR
jgi:hypothetical protein